MKIKDALTMVTGNDEEYEFYSIRILSDCGETLFSLSLEDNGDLVIHSGDTFKLGEKILDTSLCAIPVAANALKIRRMEYKKGES